MRIHGISTGTVSIKPPFLRGSSAEKGRLAFLLSLKSVRHWGQPLPVMCWLIETGQELILVDTGEKAPDRQDGPSGSRFKLETKDELVPSLQRLGFAPSDITKVILTHLHSDHVGGLSSLPGLPVWVSPEEWQATTQWPGRFTRRLDAPVPHGFRPHLIDWQAQAVGPFARSAKIDQAGHVLAVPTPGHSPGHISVIVRLAKHTIMLAGDVTYSAQALDEARLQGFVADVKAQVDTISRVKSWLEATGARYLPSHDWISTNPGNWTD